ncbi:MAG: nitroreductase family protein [Acidobacteriaceae bacterium]|nr:nitroreductase family protein [Acidobacteriaceae bacterium]MBV9306070.1 nitroreductase family protein [Acidobacteriaceae bacterium]MBV9675955.1 nitroreductase family protein [Acidobacteriaceae bacterium]
MSETADLEQTKHAVADVPIEDLILRRWSPRAFAEKPVSDADLKTVFTAASWAASSFNEQPWRFLVGRKGDETWNKIFHSLTPANQSWTNSAPILYASLAKKTFSHSGSLNRVAVHDVGAASATISLQAAALGLHTHGMAGFDPEALRSAFGIPDDFDPVACWALGYFGNPDRLPEKYRQMELQPRTRKPLQEFVFSGWEQAVKL